MVFTLIGQVIQCIPCTIITLVAITIASKLWTMYCMTRCKCTVRLDGKVVIVTGGNAGIGYETAKRLAKHGAKVIIASRNLEKSKAAVERIKREAGNPEVTAATLDLTKLSTIKQFAEDFNKSHDRLDILINNAGLSSKEQVYTEDGIEMGFQVNHVGPVYLTHLLLDKLVASKPSRIVFVSSGLHAFHKLDLEDLKGKTPRYYLTRYANGKVGNILSARALAQRLPSGVTANSLHPGAADTDIWTLPTEWMITVVKSLIKTAEECAQTTCHVAMAPSVANVTGQYFDCCKVASPWRVGSLEFALRVWDETVKLAESIIERKAKDA